MLSIWSESYLQFKKCNPFHATNPKKETLNQLKNFPCTIGQTKVIATSKLIENHARTPTNMLQSKRKLDTINDEDLEEEENLKRQKSTNDEIKGNIDDLLSQYSENNSHECAGSTGTTQSTQDTVSSSYSSTSSYFSSSNSKNLNKSPILNKVNYRLKKTLQNVRYL